MFLTDILHTQWLILGAGGGVIFMLAIVLTYTAGWRSPETERELAGQPVEGIRGLMRWLRGTFPWILIVTLAAVAVWSFVYPLFYAADPPNW